MTEEIRKQKILEEIIDWLKESTTLSRRELRKRANEIYDLKEFEKEYENYGRTFFSFGTSHYDEDDDNYSLGGAGPR